MEKRLIKKVKEAKGICMKVMPVVAGYPDRLVILPGNVLRLVETKAPGGTLRPAQRAFITRASACDVPVAVLHTTAQVDAWVADQISRGPGAVDASPAPGPRG